MTLDEIKPGQTATIARLRGDGAAKRRIMDMGLTKGTEVTVRKIAPLGDPIELTVRGYPACASSSLAFLMMYSAYELNKQGDNRQP